MIHPASGWILLDKPRGMGSTQAVGAVKRVLRQGGYPKTKVGHGGTLDPLAEGVLPIALGEATKLAGRMLDSDKIYAFTIAFGEETDTLDTEGEVVRTSDRRPPMAAVAAVLGHFTGEIDQIPPKYSALMIDGKRAYDRARAGEEVEMKTRRVTVHDLFLPGTGRGTIDEDDGGGAPSAISTANGPNVPVAGGRAPPGGAPPPPGGARAGALATPPP
ncbi:MAG: tRNA pseudouridine(55) synthase TruB, partial [Pseudomonadota bacterium]|nr:tRNA pseudouridine(55) synthase TruB [Pseudomonadota bacterium]